MSNFFNPIQLQDPT